MTSNKEPIRTLVVDDDNAVCQIVCRILTNRYGDELAITSTNNAEMAIGMAIANRFELCVSDLEMPGINGFKILKSLKQSNPLTQVILLTGHPDESAIKSAFSLGADDYILKPIHPMEICNSIDFMINRIRRFKRDITRTNEVTTAR